MIIVKGRNICPNPAFFVFIVFFSFCNFRNSFGINFDINMVLSLLRTPHVLCSLLFFVVYVSRSGFPSMLIAGLFVYSVAIDSCTNLSSCIWSRYVVGSYIIPWKSLVYYFFIVRKPKKRGGKRGRTGGGGIFFAVPKVHCKPQYECC